MHGINRCMLLNGNIRKDQMLGKAYGIGVGPGDPKLLTVKATEILAILSDIYLYIFYTPMTYPTL